MINILNIIYKNLFRAAAISGLIGVLAAILLIVIPSPASARVTGACANCHTMHNSQNGVTVAKDYLDADLPPQDRLLTSDCVGCHSSSTADTIVHLGTSRIPIVYNTGGYPLKPLAGGNFYDVAISGGGIDSHGHNVRGISNPDQILTTAPGTVGCFDTNSCHNSLALPDLSSTLRNGCQGCHNSIKHHGDDTGVGPVTDTGGWYRFLSAPESHEGLGGAGVTGIEDPDWEQNATASIHNTYYGGDGSDSEEPQSIGKYCAGCHYGFHAPGAPTEFFGIDNGGGGDPWLRHPSDVVIPSSGEYTNYTVYDPKVPIARPTLIGFTADVVTPGVDMVTCVSCHRAHGSQYPDMLRWDYTTMIAGGGGSGGCFVCHTTKDGN